ncbi:MAG: chemotaxis protein CheW [Planctomycetota bacterium]
MHVVIWTSKRQRYATPSSVVVEVVPMVLARPIPGVEPWLTGWFDYRGALLPLIDASQLLGHGASQILMSSRILVVQTEQRKEKPERRLGLIVEHVLGAESVAFDASAFELSPPSATGGFLGPMARVEGGALQLTIPARLPLDRIAFTNSPHATA